MSLPVNIGRADASNIGIEQAKGDYITFLDGDDTCERQRIEKQLQAILKEGSNTVCETWINVITNNHRKIKSLPTRHRDIIRGFERSFNRVTFVAGTIMASSILFREFKYRAKFKYFEDWDLLLRLYESGRVQFVNIPEPLYSYFIRSKSTRYQSDWYDFNVFNRDCQRRRRKGVSEFESLEEFLGYVKKNRLAFLYYTFLKTMISTKKIIERYWVF